MTSTVFFICEMAVIQIHYYYTCRNIGVLYVYYYMCNTFVKHIY